MQVGDQVQCDVLIIGAGPAGLGFAAALRGCGLAVTVLERQTEAALAEAAYDGREIALTWRSVRILRELGAWQRLPTDELHAIRCARVLNGQRGPGLDICPPADAPEAAAGPHAGALGILVSNHLLRRALYQTVRAEPSIELCTDSAVSSVRTDERCATVTLQDGRVLRAKLLVAADSRFSAARRAVGIPARHLDFGKTMMVCRMRHTRSNERIALEWFGHHQTLAILPLGEHQSSLVLTLPHAEIERLQALETSVFERQMRERSGGRLGELTLASERFAYPLVAVYPERFVATRFATIGDAAVGMHPVTAHGFNLGLVAQETLARLIRRESTRPGRGDPGAQAVLRAFDAAHRHATRPLYLATNAIVRLYTDESLPARLARRTLLQIARRMPPVSTQLSRVLMQSS
jgi:ubiquinone biosynthesis UbiH/UbiF/VisC/COQ6 family hydroxylase